MLVKQCCHPHYILKQLATPQVKLQFISSIFESFRGTTKNDYVDLGLVQNGVFRMFKDGTVLPQCMPKGTAEYDGWLAKLLAKLATKSRIRDDVKDLIMRIEAVPLTEDLVFDTYPQVVAKLKEFLARDGVTQEMMYNVLGYHIHHCGHSSQESICQA